jgi:hypothetical protein
MNPQQQELFDLAILRVLDANRTRFGLASENVRILMSQFGFPRAEHEAVLDRIDYLCTHPAAAPLCEEVLKGLNKSHRCWRITIAGIDYVDTRS